MTLDDDGIIWARARDIVPGDVLRDGSKVLDVLNVRDSFMKITYEWGDNGQSMYPGLTQLVALRSVQCD